MTLQETGQRILNSLHGVFWFVCSILIWPLKELKASLISIVDYMFGKTITAAQRALLIWSIVIVLVVVSLMLYAAFYAAYVPTAEISRPVFLAFSVCSSGVGICSFPSANVSFWNDEGTILEFLGTGQAYSLDVVLVMPDSQANRDLGMFMVAVKLYDREGHVSVTSQRSTMFRYSSLYMRAVDVVLLGPLYFLGFMEQKKMLRVEMFSHFVDDYYHPSVGATVEIHSHKIEVYSITLRLTAKFTGLKYLLHNWPVVSAFCAFCFNFFILAASVAVVLYQRKSQLDRQAEGEVADEYRDDLHLTSKLSTSSTQTKLSDDDDDDDEYDDPETIDLPLVQEPADFPVQEEDEGIFTELRLRRVH